MTVTQHHSNVTTRRENGDVKKPPSTLMSFIQTRLIKSIHANTSIEHTLFVIIQKIPLISRIQHTVRRKTHLTRKSTMRTIFAVKCQTLKMISNASRSQGKNQFNNVHMYCAYTKWNIFQRNCSYKPKYIDIYIYVYDLCLPLDMQTKKQLVQFWGIAAQIFALASYFERMSFCCYKIAINYSLAIWYFHFRLPVD